MKNLFIFFLLLISSPLFSATRTIANGGGNWTSAATWVEGVTVTSADNVVATASSGNVTIDATTCLAGSVVMTNMVNRMQFTAAQRLTVSGGVTLVSGQTLGGTGTLQVNAAATVASGGLTFPGNVSFGNGTTLTLGDAWTVTGAVTIATGTNVINGNSVTCLGSLIQSGTSTSGTTNFVMAGTGTCNVSVLFSNNLTLNSSGTLTGAALRFVGPGTFTYTAGTIAGTWTMNTSGSPTIDSAGMTFTNFQQGLSNSSVTLLSDLNISGNLTLPYNFANMTFNGAHNISCGTLNLNAVCTLTYPAGQTLTVASTFKCLGDGANTLLKSGTASSPAYLRFLGTTSTDICFQTLFTDIDASLSTVRILNYFGGTLTRCVNIFNVLLPIPNNGWRLNSL